MGENTKIEWCDHTVNLWHGCAKVHTGCKNCYAEAMAKRWKREIWGENTLRMEVKSAFRDLRKYEKRAKENGFKEAVFIGSMMDIFEKTILLVDSKGKKMQENTHAARIVLFSEIEAGLYDNLIFLFLTKRPENINKFIPEIWKTCPPKNVWFGTSISDQQTANELVPVLMRETPKGANLFLSVEPQVANIGLTSIPLEWDEHRLNALTGKITFPNGNCNELEQNKIRWVIQGGESGIRKREFKTEWAYFLKTQCKNAGVPYFFKQIDKVRPIPPDLLIREKPF